MVAVVMKKDEVFDADALYRHVSEKLPKYARPRFVRLMPSMMITGTFKHQKAELVRQGFNLDVVHDPLFVMDEQGQAYRPLTAENIVNYLSGRSKL